MSANAPRGLPARMLWGIRARLLAVIAVLVGVLVWSGLYAIHLSEDRMLGTMHEVQLSIARGLALSIESEFDKNWTQLFAILDILMGSGPEDDDARLKRALSVLQGSGVLEWVAVYDRDGALMGTIRRADDVRVSAPSALPPSIRERLRDSDRAVGDAYDAGDYPAVTLFVRRPGGSGGGILAGGVSLEPLCRRLGSLGEAHLGGRRGAVFVVDPAERLIAHDDVGRAARLESMSGRGVFADTRIQDALARGYGISVLYDSPEAGRSLGTIQTIPSLGLAVVVDMPEAVLLRDIRNTRTTMLSILGTALFVVVGLALAATRRFTRTVRQLSEATKRLAARDFSVRVPVDGHDELSALGEAFNDMSRALERSENQLRQSERIRRDLSRYVAPEVVEEIAADPEAAQLGGSIREVTVLFADVVSFTPLAERMEPRALLALLNELFTIATEIVMRNGGIVDKYIGDCVMAVFGAPVPRADHAERAVESAEALMRWIEAANARWIETYGTRIEIAIGIQTGPVVAGNVGSERRMDYTVMGDTVNVASRLESLARPGQILVGAATKEALGDEFSAECLGAHPLLGKDEPVDVYSIPV